MYNIFDDLLIMFIIFSLSISRLTLLINKVILKNQVFVFYFDNRLGHLKLSRLAQLGLIRQHL